MIVDTAQAAAELLAPQVAGREGEGVAVLHLGPEGRLLDTGFAEAAGTLMPVRDILAAALEMGSVALIVARSRTGGDADPGEADRDSARALAEAAAAVGIRLVDHLIFAGGQCRSFRQLGLL